MSIISYAQNFEDVMLWRALKHVKEGFYIDVGANDPEIDSVTKSFYDNGWNGINIEPIVAHHAELVSERERDINLRCAAGKENGELQIWECEVRGWATMSREVALQHENNGHSGTWHKTSVFPLREICATHVKSEIHFLKIDVEGFELDVLQGMDFIEFRPWIVVVEATAPNTSHENHESWEPILLGSDYYFVYSDGLNRFYLAAEHPELFPAFKSPPNIFDDFATAQLMRAIKSKKELEEKAKSLSILAKSHESRVAQAELRNSILEEKLKYLQELNATLEQKLALEAGKSSDLNTQLVNIYNSHSWKTTAWLRWGSYQLDLLKSKGLSSRLSALRKRLCSKSVKQTNRKEVPAVKKSDSRPHLALDMYVLGQGVKTGVYRVCDELFLRLAKHRDLELRYLLRDATSAGSQTYMSHHGIQGECVSEALAEPSRIADILLSPFGVAPESWRADKNLVHAHIIYDLIAIRRPDLFTAEASQEVHNIVASLTDKTCIFAISEYTKKDLLDYRDDLLPEQVTVIHLAAGEQFSPCQSREEMESVRLRYKIPQGVPYILSLATLEIRKNLNRVIEAFSLYMEKNPNSEMHLVLSGMSGWKLESLESALAKSGKWRNRIILTGFVEDGHLSALYSDALCFIYLSQYEGFGLPPLEAMACGTPVICANNTSLPEVIGDAGILVGADDIRATCDAITEIETSPELRKNLALRGIERSKKFDWDKCADTVLSTLLANMKKASSPS